MTFHRVKIENFIDSRYSKKALKFLIFFLLFFFSSPTFARGDCPASLKELNKILSTSFPQKAHYPLFIELVEDLTSIDWPQGSPLALQDGRKIHTQKELYHHLMKELNVDSSRIQRVRGKTSSSANDLTIDDRKVLLLIYDIALNKDQNKARKLGLIGPNESINDMFYVQNNKSEAHVKKKQPRLTDRYQERRILRQSREGAGAELSDKALAEAFEQIKNDSRISPQMLARAWDLSIPQIYKMMNGTTPIEPHEWHILKAAKDFEKEKVSLAELREHNYIPPLEAEAIEKTIASKLAKRQQNKRPPQDLNNLQVLLSTNYAFSLALKKHFKKEIGFRYSEKANINKDWALERAHKISDQDFKELRSLFKKEKQFLSELRSRNKYPPTETPFALQHQELKTLLLRDILNDPDSAILNGAVRETPIKELIGILHQKQATKETKHKTSFPSKSLAFFIGTHQSRIAGWSQGQSLPKIDQQVRILALIKAMNDRDIPTLKKYFSDSIQEKILSETDLNSIVEHFHQNLASR